MTATATVAALADEVLDWRFKAIPASAWGRTVREFLAGLRRNDSPPILDPAKIWYTTAEAAPLVTCRRPSIRSPQAYSGVGAASNPSVASAARASSRVAFSRLTRRSSGAGSSKALRSTADMRGSSQSGTSSRTASGIEG